MIGPQSRHLSYEARFTRLCHPEHALLAVVVLSATISVTWRQMSITSYGFSPIQYWSVIATQGGTQGWPPLFAYVVALYGVRAWRHDATGESAFVALLGFAGRWRTALVRIGAISVIAVGLSLAAWLTSVSTALLVGSPQLTPESLRILLVKGAWTVVCGLTFAHVGSALCVLWRSRGAALTTLLLVPWLLEPLLTQLVQSTPSLGSYANTTAYLPFTAMAATLGSSSDAQFGYGKPLLTPREAAIYSLTAAVICIGALVIRYCFSDGERQREI